MTTPYRGRGRGNYQGRGRGRSQNFLVPEIPSVPLLGDVAVYNSRQNQKIDIPSSSKTKSEPEKGSGKSYKEACDKGVQIVGSQDKDFFENQVSEIILYIEDNDLGVSRDDLDSPENAHIPWAIKTKYLESRGYPGLQGKARPGLELLLTMTESVTFTHNYQNANVNNYITFSKCHINKFLLPGEWGFNPNSDKAIKLADGKYIYFNYWDYIQAFSQAFYYQNPKNKHSWFFSINPDVIKRPIPNWVYVWWSKFGPSMRIIPPEISCLYGPWNNHSPLIKEIKPNRLITGQCPFLFFVKFQIPWIWRWSICSDLDEMNIPLLRRKFFCKWWTNFPEEDLQKMVKAISATIKVDTEQSIKGRSFQPMRAENLKDYFQKKFPEASEAEIMEKILDHMKEQFFTAYAPSQIQDWSMKSYSSQGSQDSANPYSCLAGEAQEEDEALEEAINPEDIWDSMIVTMTQMTRSKDKGKGPQQ